MPPAIIGALATAAVGSFTGTAFFGLVGWEAFFARFIVAFVISELGTLLGPKQGSSNLSQQNRTQQLMQAVGYSETVYGELMKSGTIVYASNTQNNKYVHLVIVVADHEIAGIDEIGVNSDIVPNDAFDSSGNCIAGKYSGYLRVKKFLGTASQAADPDLMAEDSNWNSNCRLAGRAGIYVRYERNQKVFPSAPNFSCLVRGKKLFDSRTGLTAWTPNCGLMANDWLQDIKFGVGVDVSKVGDAETQSAANSCEELVATQPIIMTASAIDTTTGIFTLTNASSTTLLQFQRGDTVQITSTGSIPTGFSALTDYYVIPFQFQGTPRIMLASSLIDCLANNGIGAPIIPSTAGGGTITLTKTNEPRYFGGGILPSNRPVGDCFNDVLTGLAGRTTYSGSEFRIYAGVWRGPSATINENDLRDPLTLQTRTSRAKRFNTVIGSFVSPLNNWQPSPYPQVDNDTYIANDMGDILQTQIDMPFTQRASAAQRIAKIKLELSRQEIVVTAPCKLTALQFQALDTLYMNNTRYGWSSKIFEVASWNLGFKQSSTTAAASNAAPQPGIDLVLQETASTCYDWNMGEETTTDPAPDTSLPNPFNVPGIVGLSITSVAISTKGGDTTYRAIAQWTSIIDGFVNPGGEVHFAYRLTGSTAWSRLPPIPGDAVQADIFSGALGTGYDLQVWLENTLGLIGAVTTLSNLSLGSSGGVGATNDWGSVADPVGTTNDWGNAADPVGPTNDWGGVA